MTSLAHFNSSAAITVSLTGTMKTGRLIAFGWRECRIVPAGLLTCICGEGLLYPCAAVENTALWAMCGGGLDVQQQKHSALVQPNRATHAHVTGYSTASSSNIAVWDGTWLGGESEWKENRWNEVNHVNSLKGWKYSSCTGLESFMWSMKTGQGAVCQHLVRITALCIGSVVNLPISA